MAKSLRMRVSRARVKIDRRTEVLKAVQKALEQTDVSSLDTLTRSTGATADEIREVIEQNADAFRPESRKAVEKLLAQEVTSKRLPAPGPTSGSQPHVIRANKQQPWFKAVKNPPNLGPLIHREPARDVEVLGEKMTKEDLRLMLKRVLS
jgi:hypothetical protein